MECGLLHICISVQQLASQPAQQLTLAQHSDCSSVMTGGRDLMQHNPGQYARLLTISNDKIDMEIMRDLNRTFPNHVFFHQRQGPGQRSLFHVLRAYSSHDAKVSRVTALLCVDLTAGIMTTWYTCVIQASLDTDCSSTALSASCCCAVQLSRGVFRAAVYTGKCYYAHVSFDVVAGWLCPRHGLCSSHTADVYVRRRGILDIGCIVEGSNQCTSRGHVPSRHATAAAVLVSVSAAAEAGATKAGSPPRTGTWRSMLVRLTAHWCS